MKKSKVSNCEVLQTGDRASDHSHIKRATPLQTKAKELADDARYRTELSAGLNQTRQSRTSRYRRQNPNHVKPV
jgi:hypothetical protein